jgi:uncharacterized membrane protein
MSAKYAFSVFLILHFITYLLIVLIMIYGWGLAPKSWAVIIGGYAAVSLLYPILNRTAKLLHDIIYRKSDKEAP